MSLYWYGGGSSPPFPLDDDDDEDEEDDLDLAELLLLSPSAGRAASTEVASALASMALAPPSSALDHL